MKDKPEVSGAAKRLGIGERKPPRVNDLSQSLHGRSHAFKDELYHGQGQVNSTAAWKLLVYGEGGMVGKREGEGGA